MKSLIRLSKFLYLVPKFPRSRPNDLKYLVRCSQRYYCSEKTINTKVLSNVDRKSYNKSESLESSSESSSSSESDSDDTNTGEEVNQEEELQIQILDASLQFVPDYGWTSEAIAKGAESLGYSGIVHGMFEKGGLNLVNHFYKQSNIQLEDELKKIVEKKTQEGEKFKQTDFIRDAVELRLRMNVPFIETWPKALALHASPTNFSNAFENLGTVVDTIWFYAGDKSHDLNWYSKRGILAAIYKSTEICMIQDNSEDFKDTWKFLDRRMGEIKTVGKCIKESRERLNDFGTLARVGCITFQNMVGLNSKSRR